jgi:hypothetical protein
LIGEKKFTNKNAIIFRPRTNKPPNTAGPVNPQETRTDPTILLVFKKKN